MEDRMYTYTTPTITCTLAGVDFESVDYVRIAIKGKNSMIVRVVLASDFDAETGTTLIMLTQEETAALGEGQVAIQARVRYMDGTVHPSNKIIKAMSEVLDKVVI